MFILLLLHWIMLNIMFLNVLPVFTSRGVRAWVCVIFFYITLCILTNITLLYKFSFIKRICLNMKCSFEFLGFSKYVMRLSTMMFIEKIEIQQNAVKTCDKNIDFSMVHDFYTIRYMYMFFIPKPHNDLGKRFRDRKHTTIQNPVTVIF